MVCQINVANVGQGKISETNGRQNSAMMTRSLQLTFAIVFDSGSMRFKIRIISGVLYVQGKYAIEL